MNGREEDAADSAAAAAKKAVAAMSHYRRRTRRTVFSDIEKAERGEADRQAVRRLVDEGLMEWSGERGAPKLTPVGTALLMADGLGLTFFDVCVLAVVYRFARAVPAPGGAPADGEGTDGRKREHAFVPTRTIQNYLVDWPYGELQVSKSLSYLRTAGLLPRCRQRRVECDVGHLAGMHDKLVEVDGWVEATSEQMRRVLIAPVASC